MKFLNDGGYLDEIDYEYKYQMQSEGQEISRRGRFDSLSDVFFMVAAGKRNLPKSAIKAN